MNPVRQQKLLWVLLMMLLLSGASFLLLYALRENINAFYTPSDVLQGKAPLHHTFRIGGLVLPHSLQREKDGITVHFRLSDTKNEVDVVYQGVLPDLFREGQGVLAEGTLASPTVFKAQQVLAKHDEKYMPPEVSYAVKQAEQEAKP